ncbi:MAG: GTPase ObgE, partial [Deltaproteobacteria bacterium]|nr:GTPase ObgE [Deltaproteobacteria bacterium]
LIHLIDGSNNASLNSVKAFKVVNNELKLYNPALTDKPQLIAINKMDLPESRHNYPGIEKYFEDLHLKVYPVSAATGEGIKLLINQVVSRLSQIDS